MNSAQRILMTVLVASSFSIASCSNNPAGGASEDDSASGAAAGAVGGALSGSSSTGTQAYLLQKSSPTLFASFKNAVDFLPESFAAVACPTWRTTGAGCSTSTTNMFLTLSGCSYGTSSATWSGILGLFLTSGTAACGTFPIPAGYASTFTRSFVNAPGATPAASAGVVTTPFGTTVTIDDATANLKNFTNTGITAFSNGAYGTQVSFTGGAPTSVTIARRVFAGAASSPTMDHSITGTVNVTNSGGTRTINGTITVYHNLVRVIGTSTFNNVTHTDGCCVPTGGSITTGFSAGSPAPTPLGALFVGKSESLTFNGTCGSATFTNYAGTQTAVTLTHCF